MAADDDAGDPTATSKLLELDAQVHAAALSAANDVRRTPIATAV
jgi:hypothetical protein